MKSGLEGRNNFFADVGQEFPDEVSMKSGLEGRNNHRGLPHGRGWVLSLNEVRPRRPEQSACTAARPAPATAMSQ